MDKDVFARFIRQIGGDSVADAQRWGRRFQCQVDFARAFATLKLRDSEWLPLVDAAESLVAATDATAGIDAFIQSVRDAEEILAPIATEARKFTVHCVGHGHIDMNWMWSWPETTATTHDTFASVLSLMREYPDLTYSQSQASVYALIERLHPEMFAEIKERVAEGRWEVTAANWVEGEKNYASGESLVRHLLYTRRWICEKFGLAPEDVPIDWEPDQFGHANTVPSILSRAGVRYYYACRLGGGFDHAVTGDFPRPKLFWWEAPDGARILVNRESTWYNSYVNIGDNIALPAVAFWQETGLADWMNVYGIGNHGGGPTRVEIDYLRSMSEWPVYPRIVFSTAKRWYETVASQDLSRLPVLDHELNFEFTGCYTSQSLVKQANRFGENQCVEAEALALVSGLDRSERLRDAWINVLFNQFHDILPGSGVRQTREHATALFQETAAITGAVKREAGKVLGAQVNTIALLPDTAEARDEIAAGTSVNTPFVAGAGIGAMETGISKSNGGGKRFLPYVVWNGCAWKRSEAVVVRLYDTDLDPARIVARDETGASHPTVFLGKGNDWGHHYIDMLFVARDVPALGYRTFVLCHGTVDCPAPDLAIGTRDIITTPELIVAPDRYSGALQIKRRDCAESVEFGRWGFVNERPRGMTAWVLGGTPDGSQSLVPGGYHVQGVDRNQGTFYPQGIAPVATIHQHLNVPGTKSTVRLTTRVHGFAPRVDVSAEIDWREIGDSERGIPGLVLDNLTPFRGGIARYETPFGTVVRTGFEGEDVPSMRFAYLGNPESQTGLAGVTLLNDCKYGHSVEDGRLRLRMIRSSFDPDHAPEVCRQTVRYSMVFHNSEPTSAELIRLGAAFNHPLLAFPASIGTGDSAPAQSFASSDTPNVVISALKRGEDGGVVVRLFETEGKPTVCTFRVDPALIGTAANAQCVDLLERPTAGAVKRIGNQWSVDVPAHGIVTVRFA